MTPLETSELYGHAEAEAQLLRLIEQKKLPHALLFNGPQGIGKATLAYRLAKYLLVGPKPEAEPVMGLFGPEEPEAGAGGLSTDPEHPAIRRMLAGSHGDLLVIQPVPDEKKKTAAETIFVEQVRQVIDFMHHTPAESDWRIVIIDPAEAMNTAAANALLKVLEEPPAQALLLLVSHQPGRLLPTIRSRCRKLILQSPGEEECRKIAANVPADELHALLQLTQDSPGRAVQYYQLDALQTYTALLDVLSNPQPRSMTDFAAKAAKSGPEEWQVVRALFLQALYRLCRFTAAGREPLHEPELKAFNAMHSRLPQAEWLELWERAETLLAQVNSLTMDKKQVLLSLLSACEGKAQAA